MQDMESKPRNTDRSFLRLACVLGALAVALGAFGAHGLKDRLDAQQLQTFETGVRYQMYHVFALALAAGLAQRNARRAAQVAGRLFAAGIALFSGSLYLLSTKSLLGIAHWTWLGPLTPLGGLCFILGWILLAVAAWRGHPAR